MKRAIVSLLLAGSLVGCSGGSGGSAKSAWDSVVKRCGQTDLNGPKILFFGPSNAIGTGSVWRKDNTGTYRLLYDLSQMPDPKTFNAPFSEMSCDGTYSSKFNLGATASLDATAVSGELQSEFKKAKNVSAKANSVAWVPIAEGPFGSYVDGLPASRLKDYLNSGNSLVMTRALKVTGFTTTMEFGSDVAAGLKAKLPNGPLPANLTGTAGGGLTAAWSGQGTLNITSNSDFFIAGEFQPYSPTGFASAGSKFGPADTIGDAKAARERQQL